MDLFEIVLWFLSLILSFISGFFANWFFYRKQRKESEANAEILKQLRQHAGAQIRLGNDKRGKIAQRADGTIGIDWVETLSETVSVSAKVSVEKKEKEASP